MGEENTERHRYEEVAMMQDSSGIILSAFFSERYGLGIQFPKWCGCREGTTGKNRRPSSADISTMERLKGYDRGNTQPEAQKRNYISRLYSPYSFRQFYHSNVS